jgi:hypothetical protein
MKKRPAASDETSIVPVQAPASVLRRPAASGETSIVPVQARDAVVKLCDLQAHNLTRAAFCLAEGCHKPMVDFPEHKNRRHGGTAESRKLQVGDMQELLAKRSSKAQDDEFRFPHGKHQKKNIPEVRQTDPSYFEWVLRSCVHLKWTHNDELLADAMGKHGLLPRGAPTEMPPETQLTPAEKRIKKTETHIKWAPLAQRGASYENVDRKSRAPIHRSLKALLRASPLQFVNMQIEDTMLDDLRGTICPACGHEAADKNPVSGQSERVLGALCQGFGGHTPAPINN